MKRIPSVLFLLALGVILSLGSGCESDDDDDDGEAVSTNTTPTTAGNDDERCAFSYITPEGLYYWRQGIPRHWNSELGVNAINGATNYVFTVCNGSETGSSGAVIWSVAGEQPVHTHELSLDGWLFISVYAEDATGCQTKTLTQFFYLAPYVGPP